jgi:hypothetical protein
MVAGSDDGYVRVLLLGPPFSGKRVVLEGLGRIGGSPVTPIERLVPFGPNGDLVRNAGSQTAFVLENTSVLVATLSGNVFGESVWASLAVRAKYCIPVLDSQPSRLEANLSILSMMSQIAPNADGCALWTKMDLPDAKLPPAPIEDALAGKPIFACARPGDEGASKLVAWLAQRFVESADNVPIR